MDPAVKNHVQEVLKGPIELLGQRSHRNHCDLWIVQVGRERYVVKLIEPEALAQSSDPENLAHWLLSVGNGYVRELENLNVPLPAFNQISVVVSGGQFHVVQISSSVGPDFWVQLSYKPVVLDMILRVLTPWITQWDVRELSVGIDPNPANFGRDGSFLDLYPARFLTSEGVKLVGFPQPEDPDDVTFSVKRYYHTEGLLRILRFCVGMITQTSDATERVIAAANRTYPQEIASRIASFYSQLPSTRVKAWLQTGQLEEVKMAILACGLKEVDDLREIAYFLLPPDEVNLALRMTTVDFRLPREVRAVRLEDLKRNLLLRLSE